MSRSAVTASGTSIADAAIFENSKLLIAYLYFLNIASCYFSVLYKYFAFYQLFLPAIRCRYSRDLKISAAVRWVAAKRLKSCSAVTHSDDHTVISEARFKTFLK